MSKIYECLLDFRLDFGKLETFTIYFKDTNKVLGSMHRGEYPSYGWILLIEEAKIKLKGRYQNELKDMAQILYAKYYGGD